MPNFKQFYCLYCQDFFPELLPFGCDFPVLKEKQMPSAGLRPCLCPHCQSTDRERLVFYYLKSQLSQSQSPLKVLHFAPEKNLSLYLSSQEQIDYTSADKHPQFYPHAKGIIELDITATPFADQSFDLIICNHVLEHINDDALAMKELYRLLKPQGWAILQVPFSPILPQTYEDFTLTTPSAREEAFGQRDHVRIYGQDYPQRLKQVGFQVQVLYLAQDHSEDQLRAYGINPEEPLFLAFKSLPSGEPLSVSSASCWSDAD